MTPAELDFITERLRALRLPDESAVLIDVGSVANKECGPQGAIRVTASKGKHTATAEALRLEDALLMVRARLHEAAERDAAKNKDAAA